MSSSVLPSRYGGLRTCRAGETHREGPASDRVIKPRERRAWAPAHSIASRTMKLSRGLSLLRRLLQLADPDTCNPDTAAASASSSAASASSDCAAAAASVRCAASAAGVDCTASAACVGCAASAASVSAPSGSNLYAGTMCSSVFLVEDIESRQADVRDFLLSEDNRCGVLRRYIANRTN
jgi:hypothetical protein